MMRVLFLLLSLVYTNPCSAWVGVGASGPSCPSQAAQFFTRLASQPSTANITRYCTLIKTLVDNGIWSQLDVLDIFAAPDSATALVNLVSSSFTPTLVGSPTFTANAGFAGNGTTTYINTNFNPSLGVNYAYTSAYMGVWDNTTRSTGSTTLFGSIDATPYATWIKAFTSGNNVGTINANTGYAAGYASSYNTDVYGLNSALIISQGGGYWEGIIYRNNDTVASGTIGSTISPGGAPNANVYIGGINNNGSFAQGSTDQFSVFVAGASLTPTQISVLYYALKAFIRQDHTVAPPQATAWVASQVFYEDWSEGISCCDVNFTLGTFRWYPFDFYGPNWSHPSSNSFQIINGQMNIVSLTNTNVDRAALTTAGNTSSFFTGSISGTTLTVTSVVGGQGVSPIAVGQVLAGPGLTPPGPTISSLGTGTGGTGTYNLSASLSVASSQMVGNSYIGTTFSPGGYFEVCYYAVHTLADNNAIWWPAFWTTDIKNGSYASGGTGYVGLQHFAEIDFLEVFANADHTVNEYFTEWDLSDTAGGVNSGNKVSSNQSFYPGPDLEDIVHCDGTLWVLTTQNGGTGMFKHYVNDIWVGDTISYSSTGPSSPATTPSNPNGSLFISESGVYPMILDGGFNFPMAVKSVSVWH